MAFVKVWEWSRFAFQAFNVHFVSLNWRYSITLAGAVQDARSEPEIDNCPSLSYCVA